MTSDNYINRIIATNECSIATAQKLTAALHREKKLDPRLMVRFRPLDGGLDIIPVKWFESLATDTPITCEYHSEITNVSCFSAYLRKARTWSSNPHLHQAQIER